MMSCANMSTICRLDSHYSGLIAHPDANHKRLIYSNCRAIVISGMAYGFAFGVWRSPLQGIFSAIKMPLLFFMTLLVSSLINTMTASVLRTRLSFNQVTAIVLTGMSTTAILLGSLSPVIIFFLTQTQTPSTSLSQTTSVYWLVLLLHITIITIAGLVGNVRTYRLLRSLNLTKKIAVKLMISWIAVIGFVGCEVSWLLSPFLCKPSQEPHFIAQEYFQCNFYERAWHALSQVIL